MSKILEGFEKRASVVPPKAGAYAMNMLRASKLKGAVAAPVVKPMAAATSAVVHGGVAKPLSPVAADAVKNITEKQYSKIR